MLSEKEIKEKVKKGWIKVLMSFEVLGNSEEIVKSALEDHIKKFENDPRVEVYRKNFESVEKIEEGKNILFSQICETEFLTRNFEDLINLVLFYGPSSCEILAPERIEIPIGEAQNILNTLGALMHRLTEITGGIVVKKE